MTGLRLWSGGVPLDDLGPVGDDLSIATVFGDGGCGVDQVSWSMGLPRGFTHPALKQGAVVELRRGPLAVATVINDEPDVDAWKFSAKGLLHRAADFIAVNSAGTPTNKLADAVNAAVANGLEWKVPTDLTNATISIDSVDQVLTVADLLNRYCAQTKQRWGITGSGWLRFYSDPTTPRWVLTPDAPSLASARGQVSRLRVRYATSVDESGSPATLATVVVPAVLAGQKGVVESFQDITNYDALTAPQATTIATDILKQQAPQQSFTSGITPGPGQLTNVGDVPMDGGLWLVALDVAEGAMVRSQGWRNPDVGVSGMGFDWIAGGATWSKPSGITIAPLAMSASTFSDNMAEIRAGVQAAQSAASTALAVGTPDYLQSLITPSSVSTQGATMPASAAIGDIWVNPPNGYVCTTPYASGGTMANWTQAIDPRTVALIGATATAVLAADNANAAAATAQASADGKNTIWYLASAPSSSKAGVIGDTAFVFSGGQITAQYKLTSISGSTYTWSSMQLNSAVIANLDVGKITGAMADFVALHVSEINTLTINASTTTWSTTVGTTSVVTTMDGTGISATLNGSASRVKIKSGLSVSGGSLGIESGSGLYLGLSRIYDSGNAIHLAPWNTSTGTGFVGSGVVLDGLNTGGSVVALQVSGTGHMVISSSTRRFKTEIRPILERYPLTTLRQVAAVLFRWIDHPEIDDATKDSGFIAEQIAALGISELVVRTGAGDILGVHYDRAVAFCWAMTAAAWDEIDALKAQQAADKAAQAAINAQLFAALEAS